jgi:hypothetical protein
MPSCGFVLALDVPAMAEVAFVALILDRGERRRYRTRLDRVNGTGDDDGDERTMKRRKLASSLLASTSRDRRVPVRPPRSAYGVNQLVPSCRWGKTPREGHAAVEKTLDEAAGGGTYGGRTR